VRRKHFFFEKKKQKTFAPLLRAMHFRIRVFLHSKVFLLLFLQKKKNLPGLAS